jgi:hypothetical protein
MGLAGRNIVVLDLETLRSADDCMQCSRPRDRHYTDAVLCQPVWDTIAPVRTYAPIGWEAYGALGLSIGCYYDYRDDRVHWFDSDNVAWTVDLLLERRPLIVSFNGVHFDANVMWHAGETRRGRLDFGEESLVALEQMEQDWAELWHDSYDILQELWAADPDSRFTSGLNSLQALAQATLGVGKTGHGAEAPRWWQQQRYAEVLNYCQQDVYLTKALFEHIDQGQPLIRGDGSALFLPRLRIPQA